MVPKVYSLKKIETKIITQWRKIQSYTIIHSFGSYDKHEAHEIGPLLFLMIRCSRFLFKLKTPSAYSLVLTCSVYF